jgi:hypothetical protein
MSKPWLLSDNSRRRPVALVMALSEVVLLCCGCAKIAGFQDFAVDPSGTGGHSQGGFDSNGGTEQTSVFAGGAPAGGTNATSAGGSVARGGANTGGSSVACGELNQHCCTGNVCSAANTTCNPTSSTCESCGATDGPCCPSATPCTGGGCCGVNRTCVAAGKLCGTGSGSCSAGHCSNCGQFSQPCCGGGCEFALECSANAPTTCQHCGGEGESCCNNGGWPLCSSGMVCVGTSVTSGVCARSCGTQNQACCTVTGASGGFCELASGLNCSNNVCK